MQYLATKDNKILTNDMEQILRKLKFSSSQTHTYSFHGFIKCCISETPKLCFCFCLLVACSSWPMGSQA